MDLALAKQFIANAQIPDDMKSRASRIVQAAENKGYLDPIEEDMFMRIVDEQAEELEYEAEHDPEFSLPISEALDSCIDELDKQALLSE